MSAKKNSSTDEGPFRLQDLPVEIILRILKVAVMTCTKSTPIAVDDAFDPMDGTYWLKTYKSKTSASPSSPVYRNRALSLLQPPITRTCHLLRTEGLPLFYKLNFFCSRDPFFLFSDQAVNWLKCIRKPDRTIMNLYTRLWSDYPKALQSFLIERRSKSAKITATPHTMNDSDENINFRVSKETSGIRLQKVGSYWSCQLLCQPSMEAEVLGMAVLKRSWMDSVFFFDAGDLEQQEAKEALLRKMRESSKAG